MEIGNVVVPEYTEFDRFDSVCMNASRKFARSSLRRVSLMIMNWLPITSSHTAAARPTLDELDMAYRVVTVPTSKLNPGNLLSYSLKVKDTLGL